MWPGSSQARRQAPGHLRLCLSAMTLVLWGRAGGGRQCRFGSPEARRRATGRPPPALMGSALGNRGYLVLILGDLQRQGKGGAPSPLGSVPPASAP